jgi:tetratricopeptide (TPR) repeat protein
MPLRPFVCQAKTEESIAAIADRCEIQLLEVARRNGAEDLETLARLGELYSRVGRYLDGLAIDVRLVALAPDDPIVRYNLACSLALTHQVDAAVDSLNQAIHLGYDDLEHLLEDDDLALVRTHPAFQSTIVLLRESAARQRP